MPKLKDLIPPEKLPKERKEQFSEVRPIIDGNGDKVGEYNEIIYSEENISFNACKAIYDELEIVLDKKEIENMFNNKNCLFYDIRTKTYRIGKIPTKESVNISEAIASSLFKIVRVK